MPAKQAVAWQEAGVWKPPMHEPAGRGRCYGDLENLLFRRGWRDGRCGWRGDPDAPADGSVGRRNRSTGVPLTCRDGGGRSDLTVMRAVSDPVIAAGTRSPGGRSTATLLACRGCSCRVHDTAAPVQAGDDGGARALAPRPKISMMIMRPPQHGHGGRTSVRFGAVSSVTRRRRDARAVRGRARGWPCGRRWRAGRSGGCGGSPAAGRGAGSGG